MQRAVRIAHETTILLLTLAAVGTIVLWAIGVVGTKHWSFNFQHAIGNEDGERFWYRGVFLGTDRSAITVEWNDLLDPPQRSETRRIAFAGFEITIWTPRRADLSHIVTTRIRCPSWIPLVFFAAYPILAFLRGPLRRYRRRKKGLCVDCGYDLTGNVSGVCPECGASIPAQAEASPSSTDSIL